MKKFILSFGLVLLGQAWTGLNCFANELRFTNKPSIYTVTPTGLDIDALYVISVFDDGSIAVNDRQFRDQNNVPVGRSCEGTSTETADTFTIKLDCNRGPELNIEIGLRGVDFSPREFQATLTTDSQYRGNQSFIRIGRLVPNAKYLSGLTIADFAATYEAKQPTFDITYTVVIAKDGTTTINLKSSRYETPYKKCAGKSELKNGFIVTRTTCEGTTEDGKALILNGKTRLKGAHLDNDPLEFFFQSNILDGDKLQEFGESMTLIQVQKLK